MNASSPRHHLQRACACLLAAATLLAATPAGFAQAPPATLTLAQQRSAFRAAYAAASNGQAWQPLARGLSAYPLYPYLEAAALEHGIQTATPAAIDAYLQRYPDSIPAEELRKAELAQLAQGKDWATFERFYQPGLGDALSCAALQAKLASGTRLDFDRDLAALWQQSSLPSDCTPALDAASAQGLLTPSRVWERIERAADAGKAGTVAQSAAWLPSSDAAVARQIAEALRSPGTLLGTASKLADSARTREAIGRALTRLARRDDAQAQTLWASLSRQFAFSADQRDKVLAALALYNAVSGGDDAVARLAALPASAQTDATREWRVRAAVAQGNWQAAAAAIAALTPDEMQHDEWRYWQARVAQKLGRSASALADYTALAQQATFYGFLAADRARLAYSICPLTVAPDTAAAQQLANVPGLTRAFEFFAIDMLANARREWNRAYATLTPALQQQALVLASDRGWYDRAVFALGKTGELDYYALRFPLANRQRVQGSARAAGIDPAWAYAIIRAESAWQTDAHSGADARGLMQLLPGTAKLVAHRSNLAYDGAGSLYDPAINVPLGTQYLADLAARFDGSEWLASAAYNAGPGNARRWVAARGNLDPEAFILTIPFNETRDYVTRVLSFATLYGWRLNGKPIPVSARLPAIGSAYDPPAHPERKQVVCRTPPAAGAAATARISP